MCKIFIVSKSIKKPQKRELNEKSNIVIKEFLGNLQQNMHAKFRKDSPILVEKSGEVKG